jgi:hypothetical protein
MLFPLTLSDLSLWLAVIAIILLLTSELLYAYPGNVGRFALDRSLLRWIEIGCGLAFLVTVAMRITGML